ncbi:MAG: hypothetical protein HYW27_01205 [Candidatus Aenigmarchaeota archaeon]|nr:hypothetical protein [Candidatus Aenigmarchaeota archaeon]
MASIIILATAAIFLYQNQKNEEYKNFEETWMNMDAREIREYLSKNDVSVSEEKLEQYKEQMQLWLSQVKEGKTENIRKILRKHGIESADLEDGINKLHEISKKDRFNDSEAIYTMISASVDLSVMESIEKIAENDSSLSSIQSSTIFIAFLMANNGVEATHITTEASQKLKSCMSETANNTFFCINEVSESIENILEGFIVESSLAEVDDCSRSLVIKKSNNLVQDLGKKLKSTKNPYLKFFRSLNHNIYNYCGKKAFEELKNNEKYTCYWPEDYNRYRSAMVTIAASSPFASCVVNQTIQKTEGISLKND